jgi:hypothetical protein
LAGAPPFKQIVRQETHVRANTLGIDLLQGADCGWWKMGGSRFFLAGSVRILGE